MAEVQSTSSQKSIHRIPTWLRDLDPNAYDPRVVSIGPYHYEKTQLRAMEEHKHHALNRFLNINGGISLKDIIAEFKGEPGFLENVDNCYTESMGRSESDYLLRIMALDGCFLLELLHNDRPENRALLSYVKMDMLVLDNQIPLLILRKLASIANLNLNITELIWKFYGTMNDEIPADLPDDAHHVLDAYWRKGCIRTRTGAYDGWASSWSVRELYYHGVKFRASSDGGVADGFVARGSVKDVAFKVSDLFNICKSQNGQAQQIHQSSMLRTLPTLIWRFLTLRVVEGVFYLPRLTIDGTTRPILLNLMDFERLHLRFEDTDHPVTNYVSLMGSLIRSENDVEHLRKKSILICSPGWTNESVVKMFSDLTRNVVFKGIRRENPEIDALCKRPLNKFGSFWRRVASSESSDVKALCLLLLTLYGLAITAASTYFSVAKYFDDRKHKSAVN